MIFEKDVIDYASFSITINGKWVKNNTPKWQGIAQADKPFVSISFLKSENYVQWVKSNRVHSNEQNITINLFDYDDTCSDIQFSYSISKGIGMFGTLINSIRYRPSFNNIINSGKIELFTELDSKPKVELYILYLPSELVRTGRKGIWHIRDMEGWEV
jgi:hypothetical protein